jgi:hypothetical protein
VASHPNFAFWLLKVLRHWKKCRSSGWRASVVWLEKQRIIMSRVC